jgi:chemotaxis protein CheX
MNKILLIDCSELTTKAITDLLGETCSFANQAFNDRTIPIDTNMIILEADGPIDSVGNKIARIRYTCKFSAIPLIVIKQEDDHATIEHLVSTGASDVISLDAPEGAVRQILASHLIPNRMPEEKEMEYLTPFIENTIEVLSKMASLKATFREAYFSNDMRIYGDLSGIIGLSGNSEGTVAITLYWDLASKIIARMMNISETNINAEYIHDGTGELINMISGSTKKKFSGTPFHFELSLPTVVMGSGHQLGHPDGSSIAVLIFDVKESAFILQVCLRPKAISQSSNSVSA